jgi:hypothetical protein
MSWLYSQALVEEYLEANCLDGEQFALSSGNDTQQAYCAPDKMTAFSRLSRFGMTYKPLTESLGEELLTWYLAGFHAKTSAPLEKEKDLTEKDQECGRTWHELLAKYDQDTHSWKIAQCSLLAEEQESLQTLPKSGMTANGLLWERQMLERRIKETVYGFLLPTPVSSDATSGAVIGKNDKFYTTSTGMPRKVNQNGKDGSVGLGRLVQMWPTPTAHNAKETNAPSEASRNTPTLAAQAGGKLNPTWVEWLMGWPLGWTDLKSLVTDKCHCVQQKRGGC